MKTGLTIFLKTMQFAVLFALMGCAEQAVDNSRPSTGDRKSLSQRLSESQGYTQDSEGNWAPTSDKRSMYDSKRDSPFSQKNVTKDSYRTGSYEKKSWWGSKPYETREYQDDTDGSRFQTKALQDGQVALQDGKRSSLRSSYKTNTLDKEVAREANTSGVDRPRNDYTEAKRRTYRAPSVIDWREQRNLSVEESRGILGR